MEPKFIEFPNRHAASEFVATQIAECLRDDLRTQSACALVLSGGSTPAACYQLLSDVNLEWHRVTAVLSDERWVPAGNALSNTAMVGEKLQRRKARDIALVPLYRANRSLDDAMPDIRNEIRLLPRPYSAALLGMGADGHFASLFPDAENLQGALAKNNPDRVVAVSTAASPVERISLTLAELSQSNEIFLLIFGDEKKQVYETAMTADSALPVAQLLKLDHLSVNVVWAP